MWRSRVRGLPEFAGELPVATLADEILTPGEGQVRALLTVAGNPVSSTPDGRRLGEAIAGLDFVAAVDIYVNETTRHADVILPPTSALERDHYDLVFHALAVRNTARFTPALFDEADGRDARLGDLPRDRAAHRSGCSAAGGRSSAGWCRRRGCGSRPTRTIDLLLRTGTARLSVRRLRARPGRPRPARAVPARAADDPGHAGRRPRRRRCSTTWPGSTRPRSHADGLLLVGRRHQRDNNSWMHNTARLTKGRARHQLLMHPDDLADARDRRRVRRPRRLGGRRGRGGGAGQHGHDARRGEPAARLRPPAATASGCGTPSSCRARR